MILEAQNVVCGYGENVVVNGVSFSVRSGEVCSLLGPNGVGKTTLFKTMLGFLKMKGGDIQLDGESVKKWPKRKLARSLGYVPQVHDPPFPYKVMDVVLLGRMSHIGFFASPGKEDRDVAEHTLEILGVPYLRDKVYTEISGGERQMVLIARALVQEPDFLVLDEPTSNLDYGNQVRVLQHINALAAKGLGILMTTHQPEHVFMCPGKVALMQRGGGFSFGTPEEVVTGEHLMEAYGVEVEIASVPVRGGTYQKTCVPVMQNIS